MALWIQEVRVPVMTTHRSVTASTMKYGSMAELLDAARNRRTMMMVMTLPNTPRRASTGSMTVTAQAMFFVSGKEDVSMLADGDGGYVAVFTEIALLFSIIARAVL